MRGRILLVRFGLGRSREITAYGCVGKCEFYGGFSLLVECNGNGNSGMTSPGMPYSRSGSSLIDQKLRVLDAR